MHTFSKVGQHADFSSSASVDKTIVDFHLGYNCMNFGLSRNYFAHKQQKKM